MKKIIIILFVFVFAVLPVFAADDVLPAPDQNKDGKVSQKEYLDAQDRLFDRYDKNGDGVLTREEIKLIDKIDAEKFIKDVDADKDGKILKKEYRQAAKKSFAIFDKNRNGFIDRQEWASGRSELYSPFSPLTSE